MSTRIRLKDVADQIAGKVDPSVKVGSSFDRDFLESFAKHLPEVWVVGIDTRPSDPGAGFSGRMRQYMHADVSIRVMVARYPEGVVDVESAFGNLCDDVSDALIGWSLPESKEPFVWASSSDGEISQSVIYCDMVFRTLISYTR